MDQNELCKPDVSEEMAKDLAFKLYGLQVLSIEEVVSYDDKNFHIMVSSEHSNPHVKSESPHGYMLKVMNTLRSSIPGHFESMHSIMKHASQKGLHVPVPVPNLGGHTWSLEKIPLQKAKDKGNIGELETGLCGVQLLIYLPGVPLSGVTSTCDVLYQWGKLLAEFHNATQDFSSETLMRKDIFWTLTHIPSIEEFIYVLTNEQRELVLEVLTAYPDQVPQVIDSLPKGYIHGDFNENNILARKNCNRRENSSSEYTVEVILDFDDVHHASYAWDVGVMLAYVCIDCKTMDPVTSTGHALAGYLQHRPLSKKEISFLKICIASRLAQSFVMGAHSYSLYPDNSYLLLSGKTGWTSLRQIWDTPQEKLIGRWKVIQETYQKSPVT